MPDVVTDLQDAKTLLQEALEAIAQRHTYNDMEDAKAFVEAAASCLRRHERYNKIIYFHETPICDYEQAMQKNITDALFSITCGIWEEGSKTRMERPRI